MHYRTRFAHARRLRWIVLVRLFVVFGAGLLTFAVLEGAFTPTAPDDQTRYCKSGLSDNSGWVWYCSNSPIDVLPASSH